MEEPPGGESHVVGGVVGGLAALALIAGFLWRRNRRAGTRAPKCQGSAVNAAYEQPVAGSPDDPMYDGVLTSAPGAYSGMYGPGSNAYEQPVAGSPFARYAANGNSWNDYVQNDGLDTLLANDVACTGAAQSGFEACLHGGEYRQLPVPSQSSCTGLSATDNLGVFDWHCDDTPGQAWMVSTGMKDGKHLSHLIDWSGTPV